MFFAISIFFPEGQEEGDTGVGNFGLRQFQASCRDCFVVVSSGEPLGSIWGSFSVLPASSLLTFRKAWSSSIAWAGTHPEMQGYTDLCGFHRAILRYWVGYIVRHQSIQRSFWSPTLRLGIIQLPSKYSKASLPSAWFLKSTLRTKKSSWNQLYHKLISINKS